MIKPAGVTPKMIGAVQNSNGPTYYLLATDGRLFALGSNQNFNFADNTQTDSDTWKEITGSQTINGTTYTLGGNIAWISPNEHYQQGRGMNLLTTDAKILHDWDNYQASLIDYQYTAYRNNSGSAGFHTKHTELKQFFSRTGTAGTGTKETETNTPS